MKAVWLKSSRRAPMLPGAAEDKALSVVRRMHTWGTPAGAQSDANSGEFCAPMADTLMREHFCAPAVNTLARRKFACDDCRNAAAPTVSASMCRRGTRLCADEEHAYMPTGNTILRRRWAPVRPRRPIRGQRGTGSTLEIAREEKNDALLHAHRAGLPCGITPPL